MAKKVEEVRDGFLGDLPEELRIKVMAIHKIIVDKTRAEFKLPKYASINQQGWAKSMLEEFLAEPTDKNHIGSVRVYRKGKRCKCMIQMTGHVTNNRNTDDEELFHGMIRNVFVSIRSQVRRKFDCTITCESEHGEPFEGYDIWTKQKTAADVWQLFEDKKIKRIIPMKESATDMIVAGMEELPYGLQKTIYETCESISGDIDDICGYTEIRNCGNEYTGSIFLCEGFDLKQIKRDEKAGKTKDKDDEDPWNAMANLIKSTPKEVLRERMRERKKAKYFTQYQEEFESNNPCKFLNYDEESKTIEIGLEESYCEKLYEYLEDHTEENESCAPITEATKETVAFVGSNSFKLVPTSDGKQYDVYDGSKEIGTIDAASYRSELNQLAKEQGYEESVWAPFIESVNPSAKKTMQALTQRIINDPKALTQQALNIYGNVITKELLSSWAPGYNKFVIKLDSSKKGSEVEFKIPKITQDFTTRFIDGRESIQGFLHRDPQIVLKVSPAIFSTMKSKDDAFNFFQAAAKYYSKGVDTYTTKIATSFMKLNTSLKNVIRTTNLSSIVVCSIQILFSFDNVDMSDKKTFRISNDNIKTVTQFISNIATRYKAPEKEKKAILSDLNQIVQSFRESSEDIQFGNLVTEVAKYYEGGYNTELETAARNFIHEQYDMKWLTESTDPDIKYYQEKFGVKKLKKIPADLVAYISIEAEAIRDANDKLLLASYTISKIEIVEWYIELLEVGSKKYVVPHTKPYLETVRTQLLACYKKIMDTKIKNPNDRPIIDIKYPKGYEG